MLRPGGPGRGFTYLGLMFLVTLLAMTSVLASTLWSTLQRREREAELLFVGAQFQAAIERYALGARGSEPRYPQRLEALLRDDRVPEVRRHLRRIYADPMTGRADWGLVRDAQGGIVGVHSLSPSGPAPGTLNAQRFASAAKPGQALRYSDWRFNAASVGAAASAAQSASSGVGSGATSGAVATPAKTE